ncbi:probable UDP-glucosyl transferase 73B6 [Malania oleifera]|uniref:probable UDP-glucosyl transferase 73B6 n=1 Tax=Malania oleifera TaxID=397392 RepID=UPI0025ADD199|nr:probable UDP-glucosyl transferase 73B6 [Malania oleifera]
MAKHTNAGTAASTLSKRVPSSTHSSSPATCCNFPATPEASSGHSTIDMGLETQNLKAYFLPYLTPSHMIPLADIAMLFAARGVDVTIFATPHNALLLQKSVDSAVASSHLVSVQVFDFPSKEVGLPEGVESFSSAGSIENAAKVFQAFMILRQPMELVIRESPPDCIVSDTYCLWTSDLAAELGIPRICFHVKAFFALCAADSISCYAPHEKVQSDEDPFLLPNVPGEIRMTRSELPDWVRVPSGYTHFMNKAAEADLNCDGVVLSSIYELESKYADHYRNVLGRKAWALGPVFLQGQNKKNPPVDHRHSYVMNWLDSQKPNSVLYISFGTLTCFSSTQLLEIAMALQSSGTQFIWVVRQADGSRESEWLPEGFEKCIKGDNKGMIIRGWAPQTLILEHQATGGFVTQCGWNSIVESVTAGVPMIAWPLSADQFYNAKLVTRALKIGVDVGVNQWSQLVQESESFVSREKIEKAVGKLMGGGEEAEEMRRRTKEFGEFAKKAVEVGGSSYNDLTDLLAHVESRKQKTQK